MKNLTKQIQDKLDLWKSKNQEFEASLFQNDLDKVEFLLEEGCPIYLNEILSEDEVAQIGDSAYDDLIDDFYINFSESIEAIYLQEGKENLFELLAQYLIYQTHQIAFSFRRNYFAYTKNYSIALNYAENLFNSFGFLKSQRNNWLLGALYNTNDDFFDKFYEIYRNNQSNDPDTEYLKLDTFKCQINRLGKYYNINSWKKHYSYHFPLLFEKHLNENQNENVDSYSILILEMIKYPLSEYESESLINREKVKPIIDFILDDFASESEIKKLDYMLVGIMYEKEKELLAQLENFSNNKTSKRGMRKLFRNLSLNNALKQNTSKIEYYITECINKNDAQECLSIFQMIGLPKDKYPILESYVEIYKSTLENTVNTNKKLSKI